MKKSVLIRNKLKQILTGKIKPTPFIKWRENNELRKKSKILVEEIKLIQKNKKKIFSKKELNSLIEILEDMRTEILAQESIEKDMSHGKRRKPYPFRIRKFRKPRKYLIMDEIRLELRERNEHVIIQRWKMERDGIKRNDKVPYLSLPDKYFRFGGKKTLAQKKVRIRTEYLSLEDAIKRAKKDNPKFKLIPQLPKTLEEAIRITKERNSRFR